MGSTDTVRKRLIARAERLERHSTSPPPPMNPSRASEAMSEGRRLAKAGEYARAMAALRVAARSPRYAVKALRYQARIECTIGQPQKAIATLKDALHAAEGDDATSAGLFEEVASLYVHLNEMDEARYYQRRAVKLAPDRPEMRERLASFGPPPPPRRPHPRP